MMPATIDPPVVTPFEPIGQILVVEDNLVNQKVSAALLKRLGFVVEIANNGAEGVAKWAEGEFDAIIMDCQMPVLDGYSATAIIREKESAHPRSDGRRLPIIALTANTMPQDRQKCLDAGMDDYLTKPVAASELGAALHRWIFHLNTP